MSSCLGSPMLFGLGAQGTMKIEVLIYLGFYYTKPYCSGFSMNNSQG